MSVVELVKASCYSQMNGIAERIKADYKAEVTRRIKDKHLSSGQAAGSIEISRVGEFTYRIGSDNDHLYFFEEGNGNNTIYPTKKKALLFRDGTFHGSARPYKGRHCNRTVANKYR